MYLSLRGACGMYSLQLHKTPSLVDIYNALNKIRNSFV